VHGNAADMFGVLPSPTRAEHLYYSLFRVAPTRRSTSSPPAASRVRELAQERELLQLRDDLRGLADLASRPSDTSWLTPHVGHAQRVQRPARPRVEHGPSRR
jgi:hypothetical protein